MLFLRYDGLGRGFIQDAGSPGSYPSDFPSTPPVSGAKAQAFIERAWTSSPTKVVALFIGSPFHECGVAAGGLDTTIVGLIRGYACRRGFQLFMSCSYRLMCASSFQSAQRVLRCRCIVLGVFPSGYCFENAKQSCNRFGETTTRRHCL